MVSKETARGLIDGVFEEGALALGGLVATHLVEDEVVWRVVRNLDVLRNRALRRLDEAEEQPPAMPHPAIEQFLTNLRGEPRVA